MKMYYVLYHDCNGDDMSAFICAHTMTQAAHRWFQWWLGFGMGDENDVDRQCTVYELPAITTSVRMIDWSSIRSETFPLNALALQILSHTLAE